MPPSASGQRAPRPRQAGHRARAAVVRVCGCAGSGGRRDEAAQWFAAAPRWTYPVRRTPSSERPTWCSPLSTGPGVIHRSRIRLPGHRLGCEHVFMNDQPRDASTITCYCVDCSPSNRTPDPASGDELCSFSANRAAPQSSYGRARTDSIDCATTRATARKMVARCLPGELLEVSGSLRRRFLAQREWYAGQSLRGRGEQGAPDSDAVRSGGAA